MTDTTRGAFMYEKLTSQPEVWECAIARANAVARNYDVVNAITRSGTTTVVLDLLTRL